MGGPRRDARRAKRPADPGVRRRSSRRRRRPGGGYGRRRLPGGVTACRAADFILRVYVSGSWQGHTGTEASDALVRLVLAQRAAPQAGGSGDEPPVGLAALLPTALDAAPRLVLAEEGSRAAAEIAASFPQPGEAADLLTQWAWEGNAFRTFVADAGATDKDPSFVEVSLHRFATATGAARALPYFARSRAQVLGLTEVPVGTMDPDEAAVAGAVDGGQEATLYTLLGNVLVRVTVVVPHGYPEHAARAISNDVAASAASGTGP